MKIEIDYFRFEIHVYQNDRDWYNPYNIKNVRIKELIWSIQRFNSERKRINFFQHNFKVNLFCSLLRRHVLASQFEHVVSGKHSSDNAKRIMAENIKEIIKENLSLRLRNQKNIDWLPSAVEAGER